VISREACKQIRKAGPSEHDLRELDVVEQLAHRRIIKYLNFRQGASVLEIFVQYETLRNLQEYIERTGLNFLAQKETRIIADQTLDTLAYVLQRSIMHRDMKLEDTVVSNA